MCLLKFIFIILLLLFPFTEIFRFAMGNSIWITVNDIMIGFLIIIWIIISLIKKKKPSGFLLKPILVFIGICILSLLINFKMFSTKELTVSFLYLIRWVAYAGIYFIVKQFDYNFKKIILRMMIFSGAVIVTGGYLQYFFYPNLRNLFYLGWDDHLYRMFSSFLDPNFAGSFLVLYLLLLCSILLNLLKIKKIKTTIFILILICLTTSAVFFTYSRSGLLMFLASLFIFLSLIGKKKWFNYILFLVFLLFIVLSRNFHIENMNLLRTVSSKARVNSVIDATQIIKDNPIIGVGFNTYRYVQIKYGFRGEIGAQVSHADAGTDNSFLFILATTGIVGFISYIYLWTSILKTELLNHKKKSKSESVNKILSILIISSSIGVFINALFINSLFYPFIMEWLWILLGINSLKDIDSL